MKTISYLVLLVGFMLGVQSAWPMSQRAKLTRTWNQGLRDTALFRRVVA